MIARDTFLEPMPGDVVDVPIFCGGARLTVKSAKAGRSGRIYVAFRLEPHDGTKAEQRGRVWSLETWQRACSGAEVVVRAP